MPTGSNHSRLSRILKVIRMEMISKKLTRMDSVNGQKVKWSSQGLTIMKPSIKKKLISTKAIAFTARELNKMCLS